MNEEEIVRIIRNYGEKYRERFLLRHDKRAVETPYTAKELQEKLRDPWEALKFFLSKAFFQGRRDEISEEVARRAINTLSHDTTITDWKWSLGDLNRIRENVHADIGNPGKLRNVGKRGDVEMAISILEFLHNRVRGKRNIVAYSIARIDTGEIEKHYQELQKITQVGPKIAAFYLRDIVMLFEREIGKEFLYTLQPVDTWVRKVAGKIGITSEGDEEIREALVSLCEKYKVSPMLFNAGCWYIGKHAFEIVVDNLESLDPARSKAN